MANLYVPSTGEVYDGINGSGIQNANYSYNYGIAVGAETFENHPADATNIADYLINNLSGGTVGGYNILPNYGQGGTDGGGFNGITLRWIGYALSQGALSNPAILSWAQTNVGLAWAVRNSSGLSWNDWFAFTPAGGLYSWDCSRYSCWHARHFAAVGCSDWLQPGSVSIQRTHKRGEQQHQYNFRNFRHRFQWNSRPDYYGYRRGNRRYCFSQ